MSTPIYYQFPLYALAWGKTSRERMEAILSYCRIVRGEHELKNNPVATAAVVIPNEIKASRIHYPAFFLGGEAFHLSGGDVKAAMNYYWRIWELCKAERH